MRNIDSTYEKIRQKYVQALEKIRDINSVNYTPKTLKEKIEDIDEKDKIFERLRLSGTILKNHWDTWKDSDNFFRNKNYNNLLENEISIDPVAKKLYILKEKYNSKSSNFFRNNEKKEKEKEMLEAYRKISIINMRDRKMKKEEYNFILKSSLKQIIRHISKKSKEVSYKDKLFQLYFEPAI